MSQNDRSNSKNEPSRQFEENIKRLIREHIKVSKRMFAYHYRNNDQDEKGYDYGDNSSIDPEKWAKWARDTQEANLQSVLCQKLNIPPEKKPNIEIEPNGSKHVSVRCQYCLPGSQRIKNIRLSFRVQENDSCRESKGEHSNHRKIVVAALIATIAFLLIYLT